MKKLSIGFHPYEKRKNPKTNKTQIIMRVMLDGQKREVRLPEVYDLSETDLQMWNKHMQRVETKNSDINDYLNGIVNRRKMLDLDHLTSSSNYTATEIVDKLLGLEDSKKEITVFEYTKRYLREEVENSLKSLGTKKNYRNAINQFCIFLQLKRWDKLPIEKFKFEHANAFKKFLETPTELLGSIGIDRNECLRMYTANQVGSNNSKKSLKTQNSEVSSSTKIKNIRPVFERAIDEDLIYKNPFKKIRLTFDGEVAPMLTEAMVKRIYDLKNLSETLEYTKDFFLFMSFTGMAYIDAMKFSTQEFEVVDGMIRLLSVKRRQKTGCRIYQVLCKEATDIVFKYQEKGFSGNSLRVFPLETGESMNRKLKIIQHIAGIPFDLSTKNARVTFKNLISQSGIHDDKIVNKLMGWGKKSIADKYDRYVEEDFFRAKRKFDKYLQKILFANN